MGSTLDERRPLLGPPVTVIRSPSPVASDDARTASSFLRRYRARLRSYVPIEPLVFGYTMSRVITLTLTGFYFFDEASHMQGDPSMDSLKPCGAGGQSPDKQKAEMVQREALQLIMIGNFCDYITAVAPAVCIGPATDRFGRRLGFVLPLLGSIFLSIVFLFVIATKASVYYVFIGFVLEGLGGGFGAFFMTTFSAVADVEPAGPSRALRICFNEAVIVLGSSLAGFVAGQWRRVSDYSQPVMLAACLGVLTLLFALWGWPETGRHSPDTDKTPPAASTCDYDASSSESSSDVKRSRYANGSSIMTSHSYSSIINASRDEACPAQSPPPSRCLAVCGSPLFNVRASWRVYVRSDDATSHPARRAVLLLCILCFLLTVAVNFSKPVVETVYRMGHLCWSAVSESEFDSGWLVSHWVCILITLRVLQRGLRMTSPSLAVIGCISALAAPCIFSIATIPSFSTDMANALVFVSAASGTLARLLIPMLRSIASSVVNANEQGALFASYACVELSGAAVFNLASYQVYKATVQIWPGIIFVIMTLFFLVVLILLVVLSRLSRSRPLETEETVRAH